MRLRSLSILLLLCSSLWAQQYATILYRQAELPHAVHVSDIDSVVVKDVAEVDATYFAAQKDTVYVVQTKESHWKGKKVAFFGDSITQNGQYVNSFVSLTGCVADNQGISATHLAARNSSDSNAFEKRYSKISLTNDLVIVFGGTNDFGHSNTAEFGAFTDGPKTGKYTFYAGLHRLFKGLYDRFMKRGTPVVVMLPIHHGTEIDTPEYTINSDKSLVEGTNATTGKTFREYVNAIREVAAYYSLIVLDAYSYSGLSPMTEVGAENRKYFKDGLHLNDAGGERLARWMYPQLEAVYEMFYDF
ncbi:MAG: SGNH/GDSL hydrolase family protein [Bacteroidaceae bacterium]|nr:SGNH/GDSL hydrolase family protein [Bacteroidaceae bacterium]